MSTLNSIRDKTEPVIDVINISKLRYTDDTITPKINTSHALRFATTVALKKGIHRICSFVTPVI